MAKGAGIRLLDAQVLSNFKISKYAHAQESLPWGYGTTCRPWTCELGLATKGGTWGYSFRGYLEFPFTVLLKLQIAWVFFFFFFRWDQKWNSKYFDILKFTKRAWNQKTHQIITEIPNKRKRKDRHGWCPLPTALCIVGKTMVLFLLLFSNEGRWWK